MRIAVTGGNGFIGKYLLKFLIKEKKNKIIHLYRSKKFKHASVKNVKFDISKKIKKNLYQEIGSPEYLIHLAWDNLNNYESKSHIRTYTQNLKFFRKLHNCSLKKIFVMGTCFEYGKRNGELKESLRSNPGNNYSKSKDRLKKELFKIFKYKEPIVIWGRLFYVYGEGQDPRTLYGQFSKSIKDKKKIFNMSKGDQTRDYLNVNTVIKIIIKILKKSDKSDVINICSGRPVSLKNLVKKWQKKKKYKLKFNYGYYKNSVNEAQKFWGSTKKLKKILNK